MCAKEKQTFFVKFHTYFFKINYFSKILPIKSNYLENMANSQCFPWVEMPLFFVRSGKSMLHHTRNKGILDGKKQKACR